MNWFILGAVLLGSGLGVIASALLAGLSEIDAMAEEIVDALELDYWEDR